MIAVAPSSVVWAGALDGSWSSHWTSGGSPLPFVPFDETWEATSDPPAFVSMYEASLAGEPAAAAAARIRVERVVGEVLLVVGGDDQVWPSTRFAKDIADRRQQAGLRTTIVSRPDAGHRLLLPGESAPSGGTAMQRGGTPQADTALGQRAWPEIVRMIRGM